MRSTQWFSGHFAALSSTLDTRMILDAELAVPRIARCAILLRDMNSMRRWLVCRTLESLWGVEPRAIVVGPAGIGRGQASIPPRTGSG
jgi:hypothetical protein